MTGAGAESVEDDPLESEPELDDDDPPESKPPELAEDDPFDAGSEVDD
jgi:hypothetical protein